MANAELKEKTGVKSTFAVEIEPERVEKQIDSTLSQMKHQVEIPGFRKGRAPESLIMQRFGERIKEEAIKTLLPNVLEEIFKEKGVNPVGNPQVSDFHYEKFGPMTFTVLVEELPDIDVSGFEKLAVTWEKPEVTDQDVEDYIGEVRKSRATRQEVDRAARKGDILVVNMQRTDEKGVPLPDKRLENQIVPLYGESPSREFEDQLVGLKKGDKKLAGFAYDQSERFPELTGTRDTFQVEVLKVIEEILPELNDEFVKKLGDFADEAAFRAQVRSILESQAEMIAERGLRNKLMEAYIQDNPFEVPESLVSTVVESRLQEMRNQEGRSYVQSELRKEAVRVVKTHLLLDAVKKQKEIEATKEEIDSRVADLAEANRTTPQELRRELIREGSYDTLKGDIAREKAYEWIKEAASITEKTVSPEKA